MTYKQETLYGKVIRIGKETENNFRTIEFDVTTWRALYPNATISIVYQPPTGTAYSPTVSLSGNTLTWSPTRTDTAYEGTGTGQLILVNSAGDVVGRSDKFSVIVDDGIASGSTPPDTAPSWVEDLLTGIDTVGQAATDAALQVVTTHNGSETAHGDIREAVQTVDNIARGRATALVFDTLVQLQDWIAGTYTRPDEKTVADLITGDNLYIRDTDVKDYWWDGTTMQELEAEAPDLTDYYTKVQIDAMLPLTIEQSDYDAMVALGQIDAGRIYYIVPDGSL